MKSVSRLAVIVAALALPGFAAVSFVNPSQAYLSLITTTNALTATNSYAMWGPFEWSNLGTFAPFSGDKLVVHTYNSDTYEDGGNTVTVCRYYYRVYHTNDTGYAGIPFTSLGGVQLANLGGGTQRWGRSDSDPVNANILNALTNGTYKLELMGLCSDEYVNAVSADGGNGDLYAYFSVVGVPEPAAAVAVLGSLLLAFRRRK